MLQFNILKRDQKKTITRLILVLGGIVISIGLILYFSLLFKISRLRTYYEKIECNTVYRNNPNLPNGSKKVIQSCIPGDMAKDYIVFDKKEKWRIPLGSQIVEQPVNEIIETN